MINNIAAYRIFKLKTLSLHKLNYIIKGNNGQ